AVVRRPVPLGVRRGLVRADPVVVHPPDGGDDVRAGGQRLGRGGVRRAAADEWDGRHPGGGAEAAEQPAAGEVRLVRVGHGALLPGGRRVDGSTVRDGTDQVQVTRASAQSAWSLPTPSPPSATTSRSTCAPVRSTSTVSGA